MALVTNDACYCERNRYFRYVIIMDEQPEHESWSAKGKDTKIRNFLKTPFHKTLFADSETYSCDTIEDMFEENSKSQVSIVMGTARFRGTKTFYPDNVVFYYKMEEKVRAFILGWLEFHLRMGESNDNRSLRDYLLQLKDEQSPSLKDLKLGVFTCPYHVRWMGGKNEAISGTKAYHQQTCVLRGPARILTSRFSSERVCGKINKDSDRKRVVLFDSAKNGDVKNRREYATLLQTVFTPVQCRATFGKFCAEHNWNPRTTSWWNPLHHDGMSIESKKVSSSRQRNQ